MPTFNSHVFLKQAIESVLAQTFKDFEFIIIDDNSTDGSLSIIQRYTSDNRIKLLVNSQRVGLVRSLNIGLKHARGTFIARQDSDDISLNNRFEKQVNFLLGHPNTGLVGTGAYVINAEGKVIGQQNAVGNPAEAPASVARTRI